MKEYFYWGQSYKFVHIVIENDSFYYDKWYILFVCKVLLQKFNPFLGNVPILNHLKTPENYRFFGF